MRKYTKRVNPEIGVLVVKAIRMDNDSERMLEGLLDKLSNKDKPIVHTPASFEEITVNYTLDSIFRAFNENLMCKIESDERGHRLNSLVKLTEKEAESYMRYILVQRIKYLNGEKVNSALLSELMVPAFFYLALKCIGVFEDSESGFSFKPTTSETEDISEEEVLKIGVKFSKLKDVYASVKGVWIRTKAGDPDVMRMACVREQVVSMSPVAHPIRTYLAAFLDARISEEIESRGLYRLQYDAISTILHIMQGEGMNVC